MPKKKKPSAKEKLGKEINPFSLSQKQNPLSKREIEESAKQPASKKPRVDKRRKVEPPKAYKIDSIIERRLRTPKRLAGAS